MGTRPRTQIDEGYGPVNSHESAVENLRLELGVICEEAKTYFEQVNFALEASHGYGRYSEVLTEGHYATAQQLR